MTVMNLGAGPQPKGRTIRYYGGKAKLKDFILSSLSELGMQPGMKVLDAFSGTSVVSQALKGFGASTTANDHLYFCYAMADAHLSFDEMPKFEKLNLPKNVFTYLNELPGEADFITKNYSPFSKCERMYLSVLNDNKVDAIRNQIQDWFECGKLTKAEFHYLIASLIYAINLVSNVTGTYGAYLKFWEGRSLNKLCLVPIDVQSNGQINRALNIDAIEAVKEKYDFIYLDPPYNSRAYFSNYFLLEIIARGWYDVVPVPQGMTGQTKNIAVKSAFASKREVEGAFNQLIENANSEIIALSYSNEGLLERDKLSAMLSKHGEVKTFTFDHKRYRSVNQDGSNSRTEELLITVRKS